MMPTTYPPDYEISIGRLLQLERGYVETPADSGGATNMGITEKSLADYCLRHSFSWSLPTLDKHQAREFYYDEYWIPLRLHDFGDQGVKDVVFATAVHLGRVPAVKALQEIVSAKADGKIGNDTIIRANYYGSEILINKYCDDIKGFYDSLVKRRPKDLVFYKGWVKRINSFRPS